MNRAAWRSRARPTSRWAPWAATFVLAVLAYVPSLRSSPGRMPADTKLYLYLDPARLISDAPWTFDGRQFAGWVPHQVVAYLWPQGPWFWLFDRLGVTDWVAHRLWIGTLFFAAGAGVFWCARRFGLSPAGALAAALVYQLSPYVLPYVSRTSAMLLPWAGLGWIVGLTATAATRGRWRHAALVALVVATVGAVNATALLMVAPAPVVWLLVAGWERRISWRQAGTTALKIGGLSIVVSAWWLAAVAIQGRHGADVLAFSESLESVSFTSTSAEVWRGMGYWLDYIVDAAGPTTTAALDHVRSIRVIAAGWVLILGGVGGLIFTRSAHRRFALVLVAVGVLLGVGVHPIEDPSPLLGAVVGDGTSGFGLALRSSTRAVPLVLLGLGFGLGGLVDAVGTWAGERGRETAGRAARVGLVGLVALVALANLPALTGHRLVDPALARDEDAPVAWLDAAAALDVERDAGRVLQLPGAEFGAFRWGYTVDPPLPGLTERPLVTRDLLPLGSGPAMDLLYALDDRFQAGTVDHTAVAPVARLLGAGTVWLNGDAAFDRFRTPRPELVSDFFSVPADGLGQPVPYGAPVVNRPSVDMVDETALTDDRVGRPVAPVELVPVEDPVPVVRAAVTPVLVTGSGDGLVDAAAAGLIHGDEAIRYTGSLDPAERAQAAAGAAWVVVTDSHRLRAHHWRGSQDVTGFTESSDPNQPALPVDVADERLDVLPPGAAVTDAVHVGPVRAWATGYGEPFAYRPESRPFMAIDGDPATAWTVADRADPIGQQLILRTDGPIDRLTLRQPEGAAAVRHLAAVSVAVDGGTPLDVALDERSLQAPGQVVDLAPTDGAAEIRITLTEVAVPDPSIGPALAAVGFAEADVGLGPSVEVVRVADDLGADLAASTPLAYVFTRDRTDPRNRWRSDPEPALVRRWEQATDRSFTPEVTVRLDRRSTDADVAALIGIQGGMATAHLPGVLEAAGWAATDDDPQSAWITPFGDPVGEALTVETSTPTTSFTLTQRAGDYSPVVSVRVSGGDVSETVAVGADGVVKLAGAVPAGPTRIEIATVDARTTLDRRYGEPVVLPAAIAEVSVGARTVVPTSFDSGCRDDLLAIDGQSVPVRVDAPTGDLLAGAAAAAVPCAVSPVVPLAAGTHELVASRSLLHVDRVVLDDGARAALAAVDRDRRPEAVVTESSRLSRTIRVGPCPEGCWLVLGEGHHPKWSASVVDGDQRVDLGPPAVVAGGFNGWWIPSGDEPTVVETRWTAQGPLTFALWLTAAGMLACLVLVLADRHVARASRPLAADRPAFGWSPPVEPRTAAAATVAWVALAGLLVSPGYALLAAGAATLLILVARQPRLAGLVALGCLVVIAVVIVVVVRRERPWPSAGWPRRFEWLHPLGLFAAVSLVVSALGRREEP